MERKGGSAGEKRFSSGSNDPMKELLQQISAMGSEARCALYSFESANNATRAAQMVRSELSMSIRMGDAVVEVISYPNKTIVLLGGLVSNGDLARARETMAAQNGHFEVAAL